MTRPRAIHRLLPFISFLSFLGLSPSPCFGLTLEQLNHRAYSAAEGAPSLVTAFAQSTDGMLWLGTIAGLFRFDGVRFVRYPEPGDEPLPSSHIRALVAAPDGGLWVGFLQGGMSYLREGRVRSYGLADGLGPAAMQFAWDHEGTLWAVVSAGAARFRDHHWEVVAKIEHARGVAEDPAGRLWIATTDHVLVREPGQSEFHGVADVKLPYNTYPYIAASPHGGIWSLLPGGTLRRLDPVADAGDDDQRLTIPHEGRTPLLFDRDGNLWFGGDALYRISADQLPETTRTPGSAASVERFSHLDGLSAGFVTALFQDREGNIWVATNSGIDRFSHTNAVRLSLPLCAGIGYALVAGEGGTLWAACPRNDSPHGSLTEIRDGRIVAQRDTEKFTAGYRDTDGRVWFGGPDALAHLDNDAVVATPLPEALHGWDVQLITRDRDGTLWLSMMSQGVFRVADGRWSLFEPLPKNMAIAETTDAQGTMWFGYTDSRVARVQGRDVRLFDARDGLKIGHVTAILAQGGQIWAGGELGFARLNGAAFVPVRSGCDSSFSGISGIVATPSGDLWLNAIGGIVHLRHEELQRVIGDSGHPAQCEIFDSLDGVAGFPIQTRPQPTALATTDGRLWFALSSGIISIDADHLVRNALAPPVNIRSIGSDGKVYPNRGAILRLPIHTEDVRVDYTAGSLTIPERVHFRYKLDGSNKDWQDGGSRRDAVFTNLRPGRYAFQVVASNNDGVWNDAGATVRFEIPPAFTQTQWFLELCIAAGGASVWLLFMLRLRQARAKIRGRLEERLAERERIARDLHDTLLQGVQGLMYTVHAGAERLPKTEPTRAMLEDALARADSLISDGRDHVMGLRRESSDLELLEEQISGLISRLSPAAAGKVNLTTSGAARLVTHSVSEEITRIVGEAVQNSVTHAAANHIDIVIQYSDEALTVRICDDGRGFDRSRFEQGSPSRHFGLLGMSERAQRVGGQLEILSRESEGTQVVLRIPGERAYESSHVRGFWARLFRFGPSGADLD